MSWGLKRHHQSGRNICTRYVADTVLGFVAASIVLLSVPSQAKTCTGLQYAIESIVSQGRTIQIERYQRQPSHKSPVVIFVHGAGGVISRETNNRSLPLRDNFGEQTVACSGYVVVLAHYFDSVGIHSIRDRDEMSAYRPIWETTLRDVVSYSASLPDVDAARIAVYGESMGGFLAVSVASVDKRIKAISVFSAGLPPGLKGDHLPPLLIQHGKEDSVVTVGEAYKLRDYALQLHAPVVMRLYPDVGHYWNSDSKQKLLVTTVDFFDDELMTR